MDVLSLGDSRWKVAGEVSPGIDGRPDDLQINPSIQPHFAAGHVGARSGRGSSRLVIESIFDVRHQSDESLPSPSTMIE